MISINFASRNYQLMDRLRTGLIAASVLLAVGVVAIVWTSMTLRLYAGDLDRKVREILSTEEQIKPLLAERDRIIKDLSSMSALMDARRFSWTRLFTQIERVFPSGVAVNKVDYNPRERQLVLEATAQSPEALRNLMIGLERSLVFKEAYLRHQSVEKGIISFNVVALYQEHNASGVAPGK
jgi:Tfp pilus assembly protein PilN